MENPTRDKGMDLLGEGVGQILIGHGLGKTAIDAASIDITDALTMGILEVSTREVQLEILGKMVVMLFDEQLEAESKLKVFVELTNILKGTAVSLEKISNH